MKHNYRHVRKSCFVRFMEKVEKGDEEWHCWQWVGAKDADGYGMIAIGSGRKRPQLYRAHRLSYRLHTMFPIEPEVVRHNCHNRLCVNPLHLVGGTPGDNSNDAKISRRTALGEKNCKAKLSIGDVRRILEDSRPSLEIASEYGVTNTLINMIKRGVVWSTALGL